MLCRGVPLEGSGAVARAVAPEPIPTISSTRSRTWAMSACHPQPRAMCWTARDQP